MSHLLRPTYHDRRKAAHRVDADRFWVVLIGIDGYSSSPLRGCVADVEKMKDFLTVDLGVQEDHIRCLVSTQPSASPTRTNIIEALLSLSVDPRILHGDNIIIYFSGHGSSYFCADYYTNEIESTGCIEAICPVDRAPRNSFRGSIPDISDRELNTILAEIFRTKGHHITCILDC
ncbi:caspase domain-containing protein, partial [Armillaria borealis]